MAKDEVKEAEPAAPVVAPVEKENKVAPTPSAKKLADEQATIDFAEIQKEVQEEIKKKMGTIDVSAIIK